jgi:phage gp36-like protein
VAVYATPSDLTTHGASDLALGDVDLDAQHKAIEAASAEADSYLRVRVALPLTAPAAGASYPLDLVKAVCQIAAYDLLAVRGMAAESDLGRRAADARKWLQGIGAGDVIPAWATASVTGATGFDGPYVLEAEVDSAGEVTIGAPSLRGW